MKMQYFPETDTLAIALNRHPIASTPASAKRGQNCLTRTSPSEAKHSGNAFWMLQRGLRNASP